jgi:hypothetical protein
MVRSVRVGQFLEAWGSWLFVASSTTGKRLGCETSERVPRNDNRLCIPRAEPYNAKRGDHIELALIIVELALIIVDLKSSDD